MNRVIVKIAGVEYPIAGDESKEYLESLGLLVNKEVEDIVKSATGISLTMATTLAAINIADKLLKNGNNVSNLATIDNGNGDDLIKKMEFRLQEKDVQIEALISKLEQAETMSSSKNDIKVDDEKVKEIMDISNQFQNRIFELQQEVEILKNQLEKVEK